MVCVAGGPPDNVSACVKEIVEVDDKCYDCICYVVDTYGYPCPPVPSMCIISDLVI